MASDLRAFLAEELRRHPRVAHQALIPGDDAAARLAAALPPMPPFRTAAVGAICVVDWDHRLPSTALALRIFGYHSAASLAAGQASYDERLAEIARRDRFPEFDVPDFEALVADEAYEVELSPGGTIGKARLTSAWRREIGARDGHAATEMVRSSSEFAALQSSLVSRPSHLGGLEAVSWTPPCESGHDAWTLDVWFLLAFDGRVGTGRSFLVDVGGKKVHPSRDFSVRAG